MQPSDITVLQLVMLTMGVTLFIFLLGMLVGAEMTRKVTQKPAESQPPQ